MLERPLRIAIANPVGYVSGDSLELASVSVFFSFMVLLTDNGTYGDYRRDRIICGESIIDIYSSFRQDDLESLTTYDL